MVNERREKRRQFFGPYGDAANWQPAKAVTDPPLDPARTGRPMNFTGEKRVAANSLRGGPSVQLPPRQPQDPTGRPVNFVGDKRAAANSLKAQTGPGLQLPDRPQPDPGKFTPQGRPLPFVGEQRAAGLVPERQFAAPPPPQEQAPSDPSRLSTINPVAQAVRGALAGTDPATKAAQKAEREAKMLRSFGGGGAPVGPPVDAAMMVAAPALPGLANTLQQQADAGDNYPDPAAPVAPVAQVAPQADSRWFKLGAKRNEDGSLKAEGAGPAAPTGTAMAATVQPATTEANRLEREALAAQYPGGRQMFSNMPGEESPQAEMQRVFGPPPVAAAATAGQGTPPAASYGVAGQPGSGVINTHLSARDDQIEANLLRIDKLIAAGKTTSPKQMAQLQQMRQQAGFLRGGTDRVPVGPDGLPLQGGAQQQNPGGYSFQGSAEDAQRFFAPTGLGNPEAERNWAMAEQQRRAREPQPRVFRGGQQQPDPGLDPRSGWGWKGRQRVAEMGQDAAQNADRNRLEQQKLAMSGQESAADLALRRQQVMLENARGQERNAIDAADSASQIEGRQFDLNEQQQISTLRQRYMDPATTPEEKKQINEALRLYGKGDKGSSLKTFDTKTVDAMGNEISTPHFYNDEGYQGRAIKDGQDQQTLPPIDQMVKGQVYPTKDGPRKWDGKRLVLP